MKSGGLLLAAALIAGGCALAPVYPLYTSVEIAGSFGYAEQRFSDARYTVTYTAPVQRTYAYGGERPDQGADRFKGWTAYEREREEARMRVISASMDRALGHGKLRRNPPVQEHQYCPFDW